jgi:hypothetical protein
MSRQRSNRRRSHFSRSQRTTIVSGILCFVGLITILQLWLLVASMNAFLGGDDGVLLPAALVSLGCLGLNFGLLYYTYELDN